MRVRVCVFAQERQGATRARPSPRPRRKCALAEARVRTRSAVRAHIEFCGHDARRAHKVASATTRSKFECMHVQGDSCPAGRNARVRRHLVAVVQQHLLALPLDERYQCYEEHERRRHVPHVILHTRARTRVSPHTHPHTHAAHPPRVPWRRPPPPPLPPTSRACGRVRTSTLCFTFSPTCANKGPSTSTSKGDSCWMRWLRTNV